MFKKSYVRKAKYHPEILPADARDSDGKLLNNEGFRNLLPTAFKVNGLGVRDDVHKCIGLFENGKVETLFCPWGGSEGTREAHHFGGLHMKQAILYYRKMEKQREKLKKQQAKEALRKEALRKKALKKQAQQAQEEKRQSCAPSAPSLTSLPFFSITRRDTEDGEIVNNYINVNINCRIL